MKGSIEEIDDDILEDEEWLDASEEFGGLFGHILAPGTPEKPPKLPSPAKFSTIKKVNPPEKLTSFHALYKSTLGSSKRNRNVEVVDYIW